jgi:hypothetical protein
MAATMGGAAREFADLAKNLREVGETGLRRELFKAVDAAADPVAKAIGNTANLDAHMPSGYVEAFGRSLKITTHKTTGGTDPGVTVLVRAPTVGRGGRKVRQRNEGVITHPVFGDRERWKAQTKGMRGGFADDPVEKARPAVQRKVLEAVDRITKQATGR